MVQFNRRLPYQRNLKSCVLVRDFHKVRWIMGEVDDLCASLCFIQFTSSLDNCSVNLVAIVFTALQKSSYLSRSPMRTNWSASGNDLLLHFQWCLGLELVTAASLTWSWRHDQSVCFNDTAGPSLPIMSKVRFTFRMAAPVCHWVLEIFA